MADARSLLAKEREGRRIIHPQAKYSATGKLICLVCQLQLKSESLWNNHLRSPQHLTLLQKHQDEQAPKPTPAHEVAHTPESGNEDVMPNKKRKIAPTADEEKSPRKRNKSGAGQQESLGEGAQMMAYQEALLQVPSPLSTDLPSRPNSVPPPLLETSVMAVDEDEWAAFEKDIAAASLPIFAEATISAPALSAAELEKQAAEETYAERKTRLEAELEAEKEDAARKLEDEFDDMKDFEERVRRLKEQRDALRANASGVATSKAVKSSSGTEGENSIHSGDEDEGSTDDDDWDAFRLKL